MPDQVSIARSKWLTCSYTNQPLTQHDQLAADSIGNVFIKETLFRALLNKSLPKRFKHIRVKDLIDIHFSPNPEYNENREALSFGIDTDTFQSPFVCPVTGYPVNGNYKFCVLPCGHVVCNRAIKELKLRICGICNKDFVPNDVLELHPPVEKYKVLYMELIAKRKTERSEKKRKRQEPETAEEQSIAEGPMPKKRRRVSKKEINVSMDSKYRNTVDISTSTHDKRKRSSEAYKSIFTGVIQTNSDDDE